MSPKSNPTSVSIVIVNWNGQKDTLACLESITKLNTKGCMVRTVVVDNGSSDSSVASIQKAYPDAVVLQNTENLGFSGGYNRGIQYALQLGDAYIWLLNNDTKVHADALISLLHSFKTPTVGICGSKIYFSPGREYHKDRYSQHDRGRVIWYAGGVIDWSNMYASHRGVDQVDHGQFDEEVSTQFVTGCSMMVRREVFESIGLLDGRYFLYLEDLDISIRAKKAGYDLIYSPQSIVWHVNAGATGGAGSLLHTYYQTRNRLLFGFTYASMRTKFALVRESIRFMFFGTKVQKQAILDALYHKFGNQYSWKI